MRDNFLRSTRLVSGSHMTETSTTLAYASLVLSSLVRFALTIADLNGLDILSSDIQNSYLTSECQLKIWTRAGLECGSESGTTIIFRMTLYGLKSSGTAFCAHSAETLNAIGFISTKADPVVWHRPAVKTNGFDYYKYNLCYVNDILCISHYPGIALEWIQAVFKLKWDKMEQLKIYLGDQVKNMIVDGA